MSTRKEASIGIDVGSSSSSHKTRHILPWAFLGLAAGATVLSELVPALLALLTRSTYSLPGWVMPVTAILIALMVYIPGPLRDASPELDD